MLEHIFVATNTRTAGGELLEVAFSCQSTTEQWRELVSQQRELVMIELTQESLQREIL
jgi:hypothetical protein